MIKNNVKAEIKYIDKQEADRLLSKNDTNRPFLLPRAQGYANDMEAGRWDMNGESIIVSDTGKLLDGQHRLWAISDRDLKMQFLVVYGVSEDTFDTIDTGNSRTAGDVLSIDGYSKAEADTLSTCIKLDLIMQKTGGPHCPGIVSRSLTPQVVLEAARRDSGYENSVKYILENRTKNTPVSMGSLSFLLYRFRILSDYIEEPDEWIKGLMTGANLSENDPRLWIKNRVIREFSSSTKTNQLLRRGFIIKAWHTWKNGRSVKNEFTIFRDAVDSYKYIALPKDRRTRKGR